jgi:dipeptidyl aminopeptidase/acylaminoacyl peptidase
MLAFASNRSDDPDRTPVADIWVVPASGGEPRKITPSEGPAAQPSWSPDGQSIAYFGHRNQYRGATTTHLMAAPADGSGPTRDLSEVLDRGVGIAGGSDMMTSVNPASWWSEDAAWIYFLASDRGATDVYRAAAGSRASGPAPAPQRLSCGDHVIYGLSLARDGRSAVAAVATQTDPGNLEVLALGEDCSRESLASRPVTDVNPWLRQRSVVKPEEFTVQSPDGDEVHGWIMKPAALLPGSRYPLILEIHGGPHSAYGHAFFHELQMLCGEGFGVLFTNPPGSSGYGQMFEAATHHDWGGRDFRALLAAVDEAAGLHWVDAARLGVTGGSFGGYMTNWMVGQTERFKAAVSLRSTCNRYSQFGTSDGGYQNGDFEFKGNPWDEPDFYLSRSPITYANRVKTALLLIHNENDLRCPMEQAEQFYTALKVLGRVVEMARFPNENHELSRSGQPIHRVERLGLIAAWFKKYLMEA